MQWIRLQFSVGQATLDRRRYSVVVDDVIVDKLAD